MAVYFISQRGIEGYRQELIFRTIYLYWGVFLSHRDSWKIAIKHPNRIY